MRYIKEAKQSKTDRQKRILVSHIETLVFCGYDISGYLGVPLSRFNYDVLQKETIRLKKEQEMDLNDDELDFLQSS